MTDPDTVWQFLHKWVQISPGRHSFRVNVQYVTERLPDHRGDLRIVLEHYDPSQLAIILSCEQRFNEDQQRNPELMLHAMMDRAAALHRMVVRSESDGETLTGNSMLHLETADLSTAQQRGRWRRG